MGAYSGLCQEHVLNVWWHDRTGSCFERSKQSQEEASCARVIEPNSPGQIELDTIRFASGPVSRRITPSPLVIHPEAASGRHDHSRRRSRLQSRRDASNHINEIRRIGSSAPHGRHPGPARSISSSILVRRAIRRSSDKSKSLPRLFQQAGCTFCPRDYNRRLSTEHPFRPMDFGQRRVDLL